MQGSAFLSAQTAARGSMAICFKYKRFLQILYANGRLLPGTKRWSDGGAAGPFGGAPQDSLIE